MATEMEDRISTPTEAEITRLPLWARIAFAARCAKIAFPAFERWDDGKEHIAAVKKAIVVAEQAATNTTLVSGTHAGYIDGVAAGADKAWAAADRAKADAGKRPNNC